ncbi:MAG: hypothetical protein ACKVPX_16340 [Myxococcaceae bacterium]
MSKPGQKWYAASIIIYFEFYARRRRPIPVWENVLLLRARTFSEARLKAARMGRLEEGPAEEALILFGEPARRVFGGIRKVLLCAPAVKGPRRVSPGIEDGGEATFSTFSLENPRALKALIAGKPVSLRYEK